MNPDDLKIITDPRVPPGSAYIFRSTRITDNERLLTDAEWLETLAKAAIKIENIGDDR